LLYHLKRFVNIGKVRLRIKQLAQVLDARLQQ